VPLPSKHLEWALVNAESANRNVERYQATGDPLFLVDALTDAYGAEINYLDAHRRGEAQAWGNFRAQVRRQLADTYVRPSR